MKHYTLLVSLFAAKWAAAQQEQLDKIPKCAFPCVSSYINGNQIAGCKPADIACVCSNQQFLKDISCCLAKDCSKDDIDATIKFAAGLCNANGVQTPTQLVCDQGVSSSASVSGATAAAASSPSSQQTSSTSSATAVSATNAAAAASGAPGVLGAVFAAAVAAAL